MVQSAWCELWCPPVLLWIPPAGSRDVPGCVFLTRGGDACFFSQNNRSLHVCGASDNSLLFKYGVCCNTFDIVSGCDLFMCCMKDISGIFYCGFQISVRHNELKLCIATLHLIFAFGKTYSRYCTCKCDSSWCCISVIFFFFNSFTLLIHFLGNPVFSTLRVTPCAF